MSESKVVTGVLVGPGLVVSTEGQDIEIDSWHLRAAWSFARLNQGRKIDDTLKTYIGGYKNSHEAWTYDEIAKNVVAMTAKTEMPTLQFIMEGKRVRAVASMKHLLIPPEEVLATAKAILKEPWEDVDPHLFGIEWFERKDAETGLGIQVDPGDIFTRRAINVSSFLRVWECFNPLSWAGTGNFQRFGGSAKYTRVLRIKVRSELEPRLREAIGSARLALRDLENVIERSKLEEIDPAEAKVVLTAFASSYGIGLKTITECIEELERKDDYSRYGVAMAASWSAQNGVIYRANVEGQKNSRQHMSSVAAAIMSVKDFPETVNLACKWLKKQKYDLVKELHLDLFLETTE